MQPVILELPGEIFHTTRLSESELKTELAVHLFEIGKLSFGKARQLTELNIWQFMQLLGSRNISIHYDVKEYEEDLTTLKKLGRI
jgi:predicted HTH domain antitoxin